MARPRPAWMACCRGRSSIASSNVKPSPIGWSTGRSASSASKGTRASARASSSTSSSTRSARAATSAFTGVRPPPPGRWICTALVQLISKEPAPAWTGSALVRLETVLRELGDDPVVVAIEHAESLLDERSHRVIDPTLADAFDMLSTNASHRVSIVLESSHGARLPVALNWPDEQTVAVPRLEPDDFRTLLRALHPRMDAALTELSEAQFRSW